MPRPFSHRVTIPVVHGDSVIATKNLVGVRRIDAAHEAIQLAAWLSENIPCTVLDRLAILIEEVSHKQNLTQATFDATRAEFGPQTTDANNFDMDIYERLARQKLVEHGYV